ncbi:hypothetical protein G7Y89_g11145 [Cudoniella acicularis]|uniref:Uncharacterized protein n=1 Tax=Cudoniella acicularis TaxID=354080 RepID=A0A8H4RCG7_9HELO|nr:hypothetical protein G7Y89_g11145 [Cudoniella acicularis]
MAPHEELTAFKEDSEADEASKDQKGEETVTSTEKATSRMMRQAWDEKVANRRRKRQEKRFKKRQARQINLMQVKTEPRGTEGENVEMMDEVTTANGP